MPRAYAESMPPVGLTNPGLWNPRNDEWDRYLTDEKKHATRDEYRHMLCYGVFTAAAHYAALTDAVATLRAKNATARDTADANDLLDSAIRTIATCGQADEDRLTYLRRFKCKKALTGEERVAERLVYSRFVDTTAAERSSNGVDGLFNAMNDKRLEVSLAAKAQDAAQFKGGGSGGSGGGSGNIRIKEQERAELARTQTATLQRRGRTKTRTKTRSRASLSPATLRGRLLPRRPRSRAGGVPRRSESCYPSSSYMRHRVRRQWRQWQDIRASDQVLRWIQEGVRIPFKHNRPPPNFHNGISMQDATPAQLAFLEGELARFVESGAWEFGTCRNWVSRLFLVPKPGVNQWRCIIDLRVLNSYCVRKRLKMEALLGVRHLTKKGDYMFSFDLQDGFYALGIAEADRDYFTVDVRGQLYRLAGLPMGWSLSPYYFVTLTQALHLRQRLASLLDALGLQRNPTKGFWEPCKFGRHIGVDIDSASGMFYASADKLNRLIGRATRNAGGSHQSNGKPIHRPVETTYLHTDSSGYGWGGVLNGMLEARGFWSSADEYQHITWKELKAVRLAMESFLPHLAGRNVLLREDNKAKLQQSGAAATVVAPRWEGKAWHQALTEMAVEELTVAPRAGLFRPGRRDGRDAWAPATAASYASCMKQYSRFCEEGRRLALAADPGTMARYVTWLGNLGTIKASSLQPYLSAVNNFVKDYRGREPMALGDMVSKVRKGLAASQVTLNPELMRAPLPARVVLKALMTLAKSPTAGVGTYLGHGAKYRAAYVIGVTMQKIKYFGGWAMESSM
eukprot:jgi/Tetstr1/438467/TSEL_027022.t1